MYQATHAGKPKPLTPQPQPSMFPVRLSNPSPQEPDILQCINGASLTITLTTSSPHILHPISLTLILSPTPTLTAPQLFKAMDKDGSGVIGMRDVSMWLKGERGKLSRPRVRARVRVGVGG